jgi:trehalose/maltose hydrolase-like predicted phosphorylase
MMNLFRKKEEKKSDFEIEDDDEESKNENFSLLHLLQMMNTSTNFE